MQVQDFGLGSPTIPATSQGHTSQAGTKHLSTDTQRCLGTHPPATSYRRDGSGKLLSRSLLRQPDDGLVLVCGHVGLMWVKIKINLLPSCPLLH